MFPINSTEKLPLTPRCQLKRKPLSGQAGQQLLGPAVVVERGEREDRQEKRDSTATVYTANVTAKEEEMKRGRGAFGPRFE